MPDLQVQMVMDNIARFGANPYSLAWHIRITSGLVQIADQANGALGADLIGDAKSLTPSVGAQRGVVGQWNVDPAIDPDDLELLQLAYRRAAFPSNLELQGQLCEAICKQSVDNNVPLSEGTVWAVVKRLMFNEPGRMKMAMRQFSRQFEAVRKNRLALIEHQINFANHSLRYEHLILQLPDHFDPQHVVLGRALPRQIELDGLNPPQRIVLVTEGQLLREYEARKARYKDVVENAGATEGALERAVVLAEQEIVHLTRLWCLNLGYIPKYPSTARSERNVAIVSQAQQKIDALTDLAGLSGISVETNVEVDLTPPHNSGLEVLEVRIKNREVFDVFGSNSPFAKGWVVFGPKGVAKHAACAVGRYCDTYAWVPRDKSPVLYDFVKIILSLAPLEKQDIVPGVGPAFAPSLR